MSDRELLELAAKAAGLPPGNDVGQYAWDPQQECLICIGVSIRSDTPWNPLEDDGDALRLAVQCGIEVSIVDDEPGRDGIDSRACAGYATASDPRVRYVFEDHKGNLFAATRRAIVRAAAEIGKAMP